MSEPSEKEDHPTVEPEPQTLENADIVEHIEALQDSKEESREFATYAEATIDSCKFVNSGKKKVKPSELHLYVSTMNKSPAYDKVVGVGTKKTAKSPVVPLIRIDSDPLTIHSKPPTKGIHFNAVDFSDSSKKLAASLTKTKSLEMKERDELYMQYVKALQNRSAEFIWEWWETGKAPA